MIEPTFKKVGSINIIPNNEITGENTSPGEKPSTHSDKRSSYNGEADDDADDGGPEEDPDNYPDDTSCDDSLKNMSEMEVYTKFFSTSTKLTINVFRGQIVDQQGHACRDIDKVKKNFYGLETRLESEMSKDGDFSSSGSGDWSNDREAFLDFIH
ncbi:hypothetical protein DdX_21486 [Ditylenchus destructor]|uniref:Uncharacterized protein n=1 Tax=Ditylenchus destructor TaxID=166010 RepID=A0AAD4MEU7_9BILA|nr:hypothetical protein DdX_21486 [Ditylenchus destructor]